MSDEPSWPLWIAALVGGATLLAGWLAVVSWIGADTTALGGMLVALVVVVGLAVRPLIVDVASGLVLRSTRAVEVGDVIRCGPVQGTVRERLATVLRIEQVDGTWANLAYRHVFDHPLENLSRSRQRRVRIEVPVPTGADVDQVEAAVRDALQADERILDKPAPLVRVGAIVDDAARLEAIVWVHGDPDDVAGRLTLLARAAAADPSPAAAGPAAVPAQSE